MVQQRPEQEETDAVIVDEQELRKFIIWVYASAAVLCILSAISWIVISMARVNLQEELEVPPFIWAFVAFICRSILSCIPPLDAARQLSWLLSLLTVFFITLFTSYYVVLLDAPVIISCLVVAAIALIVLHLYGTKAPLWMLPNIMCTCTVFILCTIAMITVFLLLVFTENSVYGIIAGALLCLLIIVMAPIQAMYICGRLRNVPLSQTAICSNGVYIHFAFLFICCIIFGLYHVYDRLSK
ncbi:hypothetical protein KR018_000964 [Drosophila ironensis]|nr:hypothetical protein KR018_000964 [Drosophila ironensis]